MDTRIRGSQNKTCLGLFKFVEQYSCGVGRSFTDVEFFDRARLLLVKFIEAVPTNGILLRSDPLANSKVCHRTHLLQMLNSLTGRGCSS